MATVFNDLPGVRRREIDLSDVLVARTGNTVGTVIRSYKGPIKRPMVITNPKSYVTTFGEPKFTSGLAPIIVNGTKKVIVPDYGYGAYGVLNVLSETASVIVVRGFDLADRYSNATATFMRNAGDSTSAYGLSGVAGSGISGTEYEEGDLFDSGDYISSLDSQWTLADNVFNIAHTAPSTFGNDVAITIERPTLSASWIYQYDGYPTLSGDGDSISAIWNSDTRVLTEFPIASQVFKVSVYVKPTDKNWSDLYNTSADRVDGKIRLTPVEEFYGAAVDIKDTERNSLFIETVVNGNSNYIYIKTQQKSASVATTRIVTSAAYVLPFDSDDSGQYVKVGALVTLSGGVSTMGSGGGSDPTLWNIFNNRRELTVDIVLAPHWLDKKFAANVAASRLDCFAEVQSNPPNKLSVSDIIANEQYGYTAPSYVGLNVGFVRVFDSYSRKDVWLPMAIFAAMVDLRTTRLTKPWIAPAGTNRGVLSVDETLKKYDDADLDRLAGRNLNPVSYENGYGFTIWGQRTAQLKKSALDRKNVRFNLLYIENNIEISLKQFIFENNTQQTRMRIFDLVDGFLGGVAAAGGLYDYKVVCDDTNNPPSVIDTNRLNVDIYVQPTKTAEIINFTTVVTKTGESFNTVQLQYV